METKICCTCKENKKVDQFYKRSNSTDGLQSTCKQCMKVTHQNCRRRKIDHYRDVQKNHRRQLRDQYRAWKSEQGCACCGESEAVCLALHHRSPNEKEYKPSVLAQFSFEKFMEEAAKCIVVCHNCHAKIHARIITSDANGNPVLDEI